MSCTEIVVFKECGNAEYYSEAKNAWRGAMAVWNTVNKKYLNGSANIFFDANPIWDLFKDKNVSRIDRIVLGSTFDKALINKESLREVIDAYREFEKENQCTSLNEQADILEKILDECYIAVGFNQTSVNENPWVHDLYDEEKDEEYEYSYNCLESREHFWLMDLVNNIDK